MLLVAILVECRTFLRQAILAKETLSTVGCNRPGQSVSHLDLRRIRINQRLVLSDGNKTAHHLVSQHARAGDLSMALVAVKITSTERAKVHAHQGLTGAQFRIWRLLHL